MTSREAKLANIQAYADALIRRNEAKTALEQAERDLAEAQERVLPTPEG